MEKVKISGEKPFDGKILVAEDTLTLQIVERRLLESLGFTVKVANNGQEAVEQALAEHFDLILMDMRMPVMDGAEAIRVLKESGCPTPVVAVSADMPETEELFGPDDFLSKPILKQALMRIIRKFFYESACSTSSAGEESANSGRAHCSYGVEGFHFDQALSCFDGSISGYRLVVSVFLQHYPDMLHQFRSAIELGDLQAAVRGMHRFKGNLLQLGAIEMADYTARVEARLRAERELDDLDLLVEEVIQRMERTAEQLHRILPRLDRRCKI